MHDSFNFRFMSRQSDSFIALENEFVSRNMYALIFGILFLFSLSLKKLKKERFTGIFMDSYP